MVSFSCEVCNDTVVKKKLDQHRQRCHGAYFTCIDCSTTFSGSDYRNHTQCISEAEKYEKALYRGKKGKTPDTKAKNTSSVEQKSEKSESKSKDSDDSSTKSKKTSEKAKSAKSDKSLKSDKSKSKLKNATLDLSKYSGASLYKVVKLMAKESHKDKKHVMKQLQVTVEDGKLIVSL